MTLGLMPITGVTLPFVSYGGSSLLTFFILIGLALSVDRFRPIHIGPKPFEFDEDE
jgi:rod shape determining protein RodA